MHKKTRERKKPSKLKFHLQRIQRKKNLRLALECIALVTFCATRDCKWCRWDAKFMTRDIRWPRAWRREFNYEFYEIEASSALCSSKKRKIRQREIILIASVIKMHFSQNRSLKCVGKKRPRASDYIVESEAKIITLSTGKSRRENKFSTDDEHFPQCFRRLWLIEMNDGPNRANVDVYDPSLIKRARATRGILGK